MHTNIDLIKSLSHSPFYRRRILSKDIISNLLFHNILPRIAQFSRAISIFILTETKSCSKYLCRYHEVLIKDGIHRVANGLKES
jgi:hypothetical protein